jgi:hypothetical protein
MRYESIDDCLGPGATRFFGSGYRRVRYRLDDTVNRDGGVRGEAGVIYPADWSRKAGKGDLRPHLSTIDALILGAELADALVAGPRWLRRVDIKAGTAPYEAGLDRFPVTASRRPTEGAPGRPVSTVDCRIGNMDVRCEIEHGRGPVRAERPLYGHDYRDQRQAIEAVAVDVERLRADALVGLESPLVSMVDSFVVALQLGQALLYALDGIPRSASNTLWMRQTTIHSDAPQPVATGPIAARASLHHSGVLPAHGGRWRTATIVGDCLGVRTRCAVAHELPAELVA